MRRRAQAFPTDRCVFRRHLFPGVMDYGVYCKERRVYREGPMTAPTPTPRGTQRKTSAGEVAVVAAAAGVSGVIRLVKLGFFLFGVLVIGLGIWGYQRAHTPEFKMA